MEEEGQVSPSYFCELIHLKSGCFSLDPLAFTKRIKHTPKIMTKPCILPFGACFEILVENAWSWRARIVSKCEKEFWFILSCNVFLSALDHLITLYDPLLNHDALWMKTLISHSMFHSFPVSCFIYLLAELFFSYLPFSSLLLSWTYNFSSVLNSSASISKILWPGPGF